MELNTVLAWDVQIPLASVWLALKQSTTVGWVIIGTLAFASIFAWTLMVAKSLELNKIRKLNFTLEKKLGRENCSNLLNLTESSFGNHRSHYQQLLLNALKAFFRPEFGSSYLEDDDETYAQRMNHVESALRRAVAKRTEEYENNMVFLSVMEAFGAIGLTGGSIKDLAPGVSSALLTTIGGLVVAIPSVVGYNVLLDLVRRLTTDIETFASLIADRFELDWLKGQPEMEEE